MYLYAMKPSNAIRALLRLCGMPPVFLLAVLLAVSTPFSARSQLVINEIMANNSSTLANNAGDYSDWVELYNATPSAINLTAYSLTDTPTNLSRYFFPVGTIINAHEFKIVWFDTDSGPGELHTGFNLSTKGEFVGLYAPTGKVDTVTFGVQIVDLSIGRIPDGPGGVWTLNTPTPPTPEFPNRANRAALLATPFTTNGAIIITNLFINEWAATNSSGDDWLELYNAATNPIALAGLVFSTAIPPALTTNTPRPALSFIDASGFIKYNCVGNKSVKDSTDLDFKLSHNTGETISLYPIAGQTNVWIDRITFPGNNFILNFWLPDISYGRLPDGNTNVVLFTPNRTTPGASNFQSITNVAINEALTHTDPPLEDAIELYNLTATDVDISNWWLSNRAADPKKFRIPAGTIIPARGYKVFYEQRGVTTLPKPGFNTSGTGDAPDFTMNSAHGDSVYLFTGDAAGNLTGYRRSIDFGSAEHGVSFGRYITSVGVDITAMERLSLGTNAFVTVSDFRMGTGLTNPYPKMGPLVISEIMYHPPDILSGTNYLDDSLNEYVELYNITTNVVHLWDTNGPFNGLYFDSRVSPDPFWASGLTNTWRIDGMVNYTFPTNVSMAPGEALLVVNFDPVTNLTQLELFRSRYGVPDHAQIFGPYHGGKLKNSGGSIELDKSDMPQDPDHPDFRYVPYIRMDRVNFNDHLPWPMNPDGGGTALHRIVPERYGNEPTNWESAFPTPGWEPVQIASGTQVGSSFVVGFRGLSGSSYSVQYQNNLGSGPTWTPVANFNPLTNTSLKLVTNSLSTSSRFYRLVSPAQP